MQCNTNQLYENKLQCMVAPASGWNYNKNTKQTIKNKQFRIKNENIKRIKQTIQLIQIQKSI